MSLGVRSSIVGLLAVGLVVGSLAVRLLGVMSVVCHFEGVSSWIVARRPSVINFLASFYTNTLFSRR